MGRISRVVPKQWIRYEPVGALIPNTRFLMFKTPLSVELSTKIPIGKRFTTLDLIRIVAERGLTLGMVVDLTDTDRYYDKNDIEGMLIIHEKINCPGRGFIENIDLVDAFNSVVDGFLELNSDNDLVIGVHCTNGVNRCGYLICRFLIDRLGWSSHDAIDAFERARGYPIERGAYVLALHKAAKERRTKKRHKHLEEAAGSSDESDVQRLLRKRSKHKRRRKNDESGEDNGTPDMESVLNQMAIAFEQHESSLNLMGDTAVSLNTDLNVTTDLQQAYSSSQISAEDSPFIGSVGTGGTGEGEEEDDESADQDRHGTTEDNEQKMTKARKRRERRQRLHRQFELMKTGNFWKINEMQKEKFGET